MSSPPNRSAIITGGAQGMGEAIALRLAQEGVNVVVFDVKGKEAQLEGVVKQAEAKGSKVKRSERKRRCNHPTRVKSHDIQHMPRHVRVDI